MARENFLHFRVDDAVLGRIEAIAERGEGNKSQVCRMLLAQALGDDAKVAAVHEATFEFGALRKKIVRRLASEMNTRLNEILEEELQQLNAE